MADYLYQQYIDDVLSGRQVVGKWVRLAVERHVSDLETGEDRGLSFSEKAARHVIDFFGFLRHSKGEWAGQPLVLQPWQAFIIGSLFGMAVARFSVDKARESIRQGSMRAIREPAAGPP